MIEYNCCMKRANLLGFDIDTYCFDDAVLFAKSLTGQVVTINPEMIDYASKNPKFKEIISQAELVIPDGIGIQIGLCIKGYKVRRIPGIEFAKRILKETSGSPVAFVGAKPNIAEKAVINLSKEIPKLNPVIVQDGYFSDTETIYQSLLSKRPRIVLVALGSPKQEEFIYNLKKDMPYALFIGIGGSFDVWSGEVKRAPEFFQKLGLEWLYRTIKEPKRLKRIFPVLPLFVLKVLKSEFNHAVRN